MYLGAVNSKVGDRLALRVDLRSHPRVVGMQPIDLKARIVAADEIEKLVELFRPKTVVDVGRPLDVGPELTAPADVDGGVEAEPGAVRHGIDVPFEGRAS